MNHRQRFLEIADFLRPYQTIWQNEIMLLYPDPLRHFPMEWVEDLASIKNPQDIIRLEKKEVFDYISCPPLIGYYRRREALIEVPAAPERSPMPEDRFTFLYMIPKKQYEIRRLAPQIDHYYQTRGIERIVDIGGGIGLLAQSLSNHYGHRVTSLDLDAQMQETGRERNKSNARPGRELVDYRNVRVHAEEEQFTSLLGGGKMSVGLHTCGPLAVDQLKASARSQTTAIVNLGCCYHKIHDSGAQNISRYARENAPLELSQFALTLASRAHKKMPEKDFIFKNKVKRYRYALHALLHDEYGVEEFRPLGNTPRRLYEGPFADYAFEQLSRAGEAPKHTAGQLTAFFEDEKRQTMIWNMLAAGILRDSMGRLLELYLLLDRVIYLEEQGYEARLEACFDEEISSRNLGIFASTRGSL